MILSDSKESRLTYKVEETAALQKKGKKALKQCLPPNNGRDRDKHKNKRKRSVKNGFVKI